MTSPMLNEMAGYDFSHGEILFFTSEYEWGVDTEVERMAEDGRLAEAMAKELGLSYEINSTHGNASIMMEIQWSFWKDTI
jgi:hypothetical protein